MKSIVNTCENITCIFRKNEFNFKSTFRLNRVINKNYQLDEQYTEKPDFTYPTVNINDDDGRTYFVGNSRTTVE